MHVLVTGHTGFKGAWVTLMLKQRGHEVSGIALDPQPWSLFQQAELTKLLKHDVRLDIRRNREFFESSRGIRPDVVLHMAAQSLVRPSYSDPRLTIETNVLGTLNILEAISAIDSVQAAVVVTTDKVYQNVGRLDGYVESDPLGGHDPYSASKAMADILTTSWASSFPGTPTAIARAGNVIGGGDVSADRLMPDVIRALKDGTPVRLRHPASVRPWQHVLDCLSGYLLLMDSLLAGEGSGAWNFGPEPSAVRTVEETADLATRMWGGSDSWVSDPGEHPHEADVLTLDSSRARSELRWSDRLDYEAAVGWTIEWEKRVFAGQAPRDVSLEQIEHYEALGGAT